MMVENKVWLLLACTLVLISSSEVNPFNEETAQSIFGEGQKTAFFLFGNDNSESEIAVKAFK